MKTIAKLFSLKKLVILSIIFISTVSCSDDSIDINNTETVSDFLDGDIAQFGKTLASNFDKHLEAVNAIGDNISMNQALTVANQVNQEHHPNLNTINSSDINQLEGYVSDNGSIKRFDEETINQYSFSNEVKTELVKLSRMISDMSSYELFQEELLSFTKELNNMTTLSDVDRRIIMLHIVSVYHAGEYLSESLLPQNTSGRFDFLDDLTCGLATIGGAVSGGLDGMITGVEVGTGVGAVVGCIATIAAGCTGADVGAEIGSGVGAIVGGVTGMISGGYSAATSSC